MLDVLNILETHWGHWKFDSNTHQISFEDSESRDAFRQDRAIMKKAADDQLKLEAKIVNQPLPQLL